MDNSKNRLFRILSAAGLGLLACGVKIWLDFSRPPSVVYSNRDISSETSAETADATAAASPAPAADSMPEDTSGALSTAAEPEEIPVYICGAVTEPGIYQIMPGSYLYEVINMAGGLLPDAAAEYMNLVFRISEAVSVYIPDNEEMQAFLDGKDGTSSEYLRTGLLQGIWGMQDNSGITDPKDGTAATAALININTADQAALETLPGVGSTTASAIISYREKNGSFLTIEDIMKVAGIKQGRFEAIREFITV